ncbi:MAG: 4Fe-4S dicluster domain-containing protein [Anaeromyxobacter sp.]
MPSLGLPIYGQKPAATGRSWRTIAEAEGAAESLAAPHGDAAPADGWSRRGFMKLLGASAALATLDACRPPREKLVPYVSAPQGVTPTLANHYATAMELDGHALGVVVTSWEGKPTKIEGNPDHRASLGGTDAPTQAQVLELYEPSRVAGYRRVAASTPRTQKALTWPGVLAELSALAKAHDKDGGARLRFLVEPTSSPTLAEYRAKVLARFPKAKLVAWSATAGEAGAGTAAAFGRPLEPTYDVARADVILSLDADFLGREGEHVRNAKGFASRRADVHLNRLYVAEPDMTVTGGTADHRFRMRGSEVLGFARAVAGALAQGHGQGALAAAGGPAGDRAKIAAAVAKDLASAPGRSLVVAGARQPAAVHALAAAMNAALGNVGTTVFYHPPVVEPSSAAAVKALADELRAGAVDVLFVTAWNPLHTAPADADLRAAVGKAKEVVALVYRDDETARAAQFRLAALHPLERWGDLRARDGQATLVQPLIAPLVEGTTELDLMAALVDEGALEPGGHKLVRDAWRRRGGFPAAPVPAAGSAAAVAGVDGNLPKPADPFERRWTEWLSAGLASAGAPKAPEAPACDFAKVAAAVAAAPAAAAGLELGFAPDYKVLDGRLADNAWMQEWPHPVTKLTWENAAHLSPATAKRLGLADGDVVKLSRAGRTVEAPALVVPGHADDAVSLALGYGQRAAGAVGGGSGFDAYALRTSDAAWYAGGATLEKAGRKVELAITQGHFTMNDGLSKEDRELAIALPVNHLEEEQHRLDKLRGAQPDILGAVDYSKEEVSWGMAIDLSKCIGCGACTVACQAENNIPVVGKKEVARSREMHWLRVDRYYQGSIEEPESVSQPLACVHCEAAPCEYVCPVNATVHSEDGLNTMVYNRCVGTRYCSNNCAYKVRRFNYLDYHQDPAPTLRMLMNPDVTVRSRGVMEKCTYCTQRIERVRIDARASGRKIGGDEVVPACGQACPADAIVFGNINDPSSKVAKLHGDARRYNLLHELGTRPRTAYLVKLRNPNPDLA